MCLMLIPSNTPKDLNILMYLLKTLGHYSIEEPSIIFIPVCIGIVLLLRSEHIEIGVHLHIFIQCQPSPSPTYSCSPLYKYFNFLQFFIKHLSDKPTIAYILLFKLAKCNTIDLFYLLLFPVVPVLMRENFLTVALSLLIQCIVVLDLADLRDNFYCLNYFYSIFYNCWGIALLK